MGKRKTNGDDMVPDGGILGKIAAMIPVGGGSFTSCRESVGGGVTAEVAFARPKIKDARTMYRAPADELPGPANME